MLPDNGTIRVFERTKPRRSAQPLLVIRVFPAESLSDMQTRKYVFLDIICRVEHEYIRRDNYPVTVCANVEISKLH